MKLRELQLEDAPLMLEWMQDNDLTSGFHSDYSSKTLQDAESFIEAGHIAKTARHFM